MDDDDEDSRNDTYYYVCQDQETLNWTHISIGTIYLFIFIFGIIGNGLVLYGFSQNRKLRQSISNSYMIHLAVTDLLFVSTLPFWAINQFKMTEWLFGLVACKLLRTISKVNMYGSIYFLTALSVDRALAVTRPTTSTVVRTRRGFRIISIVIWVGSIALSMPEIIYSKVEHDEWNKPICHMTFTVVTNETGHETEEAIETWYIKLGLYELMKCVMGFMLPIVVIIYSYSAVLYTVQCKLIGGHKGGKARATRLAAIIVATFVACWLPFHTLSLWSALGGYLQWFGLDMNSIQQCTHGKIMPYAVALAYSNSAINPFLYAFTLRPFRLTLNEKLHCFCSPRLEHRQLYQPVNNSADSKIKDLTMNTNSTSLNASVNGPSNETTQN